MARARAGFARADPKREAATWRANPTGVEPYVSADFGLRIELDRDRWGEWPGVAKDVLGAAWGARCAATGRVALSAELGVVTDPVETAPGQFTATYLAPENAPPGGTVVLRAELKNGQKPVSGSVTITFAGTPTRSIAAVERYVLRWRPRREPEQA